MADSAYNEMNDDKKSLKHIVGVVTPLPLVANMTVSSFQNARDLKIVTYVFDPADPDFGAKPLKGVCIMVSSRAAGQFLAAAADALISRLYNIK